MNINNSRTSNIDEFQNASTPSGTKCESARAVSRQKSMLPEEILAEIFLLQHVHSATDLSGPLWTYIQVCRSWRSAALNTSSLWINIRVDGKFVNRRRSDHAHQIIQFILARSRSRPLSVDLDMLGIGPSDALTASLRTLLYSSHRWVSLHYSHTHSYTPFEPFQAIWPLQAATRTFHSPEGFPALTEIVVTSVPSMDCRYVLRNSPHLEKLALIGCGFLSPHVFLNLQFHWLRSLTVAGCAVDRNGWWPHILRQAANLEELTVDRDCWIRLGGEEPSLETVLLSNLRTLVLNEFRRNVLPKLILPRLASVEIVASPRALSEVTRILQRSSCRLKRVFIFGVELLDVTVERFLRTIGSDVEDLILDGLVLNHLFDVIATPSVHFLPRLEKITVRQSSRGKAANDLRCPFELVQQVSLPLESFITAVRARMYPGPLVSRLKAVDICLSRSALDVQLAGCLSSLEGLTSIIRYTNTGPIDYDQLGNFLQYCVSFYRTSHEVLYQENMASIAGLFAIVEKRIACTSVPSIQMRHIRAAMISFSYRRSDFTAREQEFNIEERAKEIVKRLDVADVCDVGCLQDGSQFQPMGHYDQDRQSPDKARSSTSKFHELRT